MYELFVLFLEPRGEATVARETQPATPAWGVGMCTLLEEEGHLGKSLCARIRLHGAVWDWRRPDRPSLYLFRPGGRLDVIPTKNTGCTHHSRWKSSVFVEHLVQV